LGALDSRAGVGTGLALWSTPSLAGCPLRQCGRTEVPDGIPRERRLRPCLFVGRKAFPVWSRPGWTGQGISPPACVVPKCVSPGPCCPCVLLASGNLRWQEPPCRAGPEGDSEVWWVAHRTSIPSLTSHGLPAPSEPHIWGQSGSLPGGREEDRTQAKCLLQHLAPGQHLERKLLSIPELVVWSWQCRGPGSPGDRPHLRGQAQNLKPASPSSPCLSKH
jgi:hypothetical protein